jgi:hypothetical protein
MQQDATTNRLIKDGISIKNAGLVLLTVYLKLLLERLELVNNNQFISKNAQVEGVHYLQFLVTGYAQTEESFLPLNKLICGLKLTESVPNGIDISEENKQLIEGLIQAAVAHWPAIGDSSIDGFRGNWLVRDGLLLEHEDRWELIVDKKAYDILINRAPFSFSIINFEWMPKPIYVIWPY